MPKIIPKVEKMSGVSTSNYEVFNGTPPKQSNKPFIIVSVIALAGVVFAGYVLFNSWHFRVLQKVQTQAYTFGVQQTEQRVLQGVVNQLNTTGKVIIQLPTGQDASGTVQFAPVTFVPETKPMQQEAKPMQTAQVSEQVEEVN